MKITIIYEDQDLIVLNKPAGVVCNRAESVKGETLQDFMEENKLRIEKGELRNEEEKEFRSRSGLVHRLDKETSGVMVLAKNAESFQFLKNQFKQRKTKKKYLALVHGKMNLKKGTINLPLKRNILNRHKFCVNVDGKMARSEYEVLKEFENDGLVYSLVDMKIFTGRTHQIRVHLSHLGFPLVSDPLYLGKRLESDLSWCPRMFLHAKYLSFIHPKSGKRVEFEGELSEDLEEAFGRLGEN